jgi:hypothetical protein
MKQSQIFLIILGLLIIVNVVNAENTEFAYGVAGATGTIYTTNYPQYLIDHITTTKCILYPGNVGTDTMWIDYGVGVSHIIKNYSMRSGNDGFYQPRSWYFEGTNDNTTSWIVLDNKSTLGNPDGAAGAWYNYSISNNDTYRWYRIRMTAENDGGLQLSEFNLFGDDTIPETPGIIADFTCSPLSLTTSDTLSCIDNSTTTMGAVIDNYNWTFEDSTPQHATTQNPAITYTSDGVWNVTLSIWNSTVGYSNLTKVDYVTVSSSGNLSGFNRQDIMMDQIYTVIFNVKDATTHSGIPGALVSLSNGDNTTTDLFGVATFSMNYSAIVAQFGATGYYSRTISYVVDRDRTETVYLTVAPASANTTAQTMTYYTPWQVRIRIADFYGNPLPGTNVTANYIASTLPSTNISWLITAYGVNAAAASEMTNSGVAMAGQTDSNGGLSFSMFKSIQYALLITNTTSGVSATRNLYPSDQEYLIRVPLPGQVASNNTLSAMANTSLPIYQINATAYNVSVIYHDGSGLTSDVLFYVRYRNGTVLYYEDLGNPGRETVVANYTVNNLPMGTELMWSYNARRASI